MAAIEVRDLHKYYGENHAVDGLSFHVEAGEVYALLGPNGAGKSTAVEILEGHRTATSGQVSVLGFDPAKVERDFRNRIGVVLQSSGVENEFTVREVIDLYASAYRSRRSMDDVLASPDLLFLDEPTTGFDPSARRLSWDLIEEMCAGGTTVLLTTHYLDEAEHLADRVGVMGDGRLLAEGTPASLIDGISGTLVSFQLPQGIEAVDAASIFSTVMGADVRVSGRLVEATVEHSTRVVHRLTGWAVSHDMELMSLSVTRASLEDVYLQLTTGGEPADA